MKQRQTISWIILGVLVLLLSIPTYVQAAYEFYVTIEGTKQGKFKGEAQQKVTANKIAGLRFQYEVKSARDAASGQASGKRTHSPVVITKQWGSSSPQLFQACVTNEVLKTVLLEFNRTTPDGQVTVYQTIKLTNATISQIRRYTESTQELEDISFTFQTIEITDLVGKTTAVEGGVR